MTGFYMEYNTGPKWINFMHTIHTPLYAGHSKLCDVIRRNIRWRHVQKNCSDNKKVRLASKKC